MKAKIKGRETEGQFYVKQFTSVAQSLEVGGTLHFAVVVNKATKTLEIVDATLLIELDL